MRLDCEVCGEDLLALPEGAQHTKCDHVIDAFRKLKDENHQLKDRISDIQSAVLFLLDDCKEAASTQETVEVPVQFLRKLWEVAECRWYDAVTADDFIHTECLRGNVVCDVLRLFSASGDRRKELETLRNSFNHLHDMEFPNQPAELQTTDEVIAAIRT